ncbi:uncharacterized protein [Haliotis asinina]|uniref:uncharacterized protein isoform X2 n=1 Tax=Haliotis asinina TaxID=109174 RepID=UPI003531BABB
MVIMTHAVCHRMESIPHSCPPPLRGERDYEPVPEYTPQTSSKKLHTRFECKEDFLADFIPLVSAPIPSIKPAALFGSQIDPTLCVTPDKPHQGIISGKQNLPSKGTTIHHTFPSPDPRLSLTPQTITTASKLRHGAIRSDTGVIPAVPTMLLPDPILTVTPEHKLSGCSKAKSSLRAERNDPEAKSKLKYKVRFDLNAADSDAHDKSFGPDVVLDNDASIGKTTSKVYKPDLYFEEDKPDQDFHEPLSHLSTSQYVTCPSSDTTRTHVAVKMNSSVSADKDSKLKNESEGIRKPDKSVFEVCERPDLIISSSNKGPSKRKVVVTRELQEHPTVTEYQYPFDAEDRESDVEHVFSRPEYNNSLKVYNEMKKVDGMVPDVASAVQMCLNEEKLTEISEKASSKVNLCFKSSQFNGLVGLQASDEYLQRMTEREITLKGKHVMHQSRKNSSAMTFRRRLLT